MHVLTSIDAEGPLHRVALHAQHVHHLNVHPRSMLRLQHPGPASSKSRQRGVERLRVVPTPHSQTWKVTFLQNLVCKAVFMYEFGACTQGQ